MALEVDLPKYLSPCIQIRLLAFGHSHLQKNLPLRTSSQQCFRTTIRGVDSKTYQCIKSVFQIRHIFLKLGFGYFLNRSDLIQLTHKHLEKLVVLFQLYDQRFGHWQYLDVFVVYIED